MWQFFQAGELCVSRIFFQLCVRRIFYQLCVCRIISLCVQNCLTRTRVQNYLIRMLVQNCLLVIAELSDFDPIILISCRDGYLWLRPRARKMQIRRNVVNQPLADRRAFLFSVGSFLRRLVGQRRIRCGGLRKPPGLEWL